MENSSRKTPKTAKDGAVVIPIVDGSIPERSLAERSVVEEPIVEARSAGIRNAARDEEMNGQGYEAKYVRAMADLDNLRKRTGRQVADARLRERKALLLGFIEVIDSLERALDAHGAAGNPWLEGIETIQQQMLGILGQYDARPFNAIGEAFDPRRHHAVATVKPSGRASGTVVDATQIGYLLGEETVLRPAQVIVTQ